MIRTWIALVPNDHRARLIGFALLAFLVPLSRERWAPCCWCRWMAALFFRGGAAACVAVAGLAVRRDRGRAGADAARTHRYRAVSPSLTTQHDVADRLPGCPVGLVYRRNTATARHRRSRPPGRNLLPGG